MKILILFLLFSGVACAQAPDTVASRHWHLGEPVRTATERLLSRPGWTFQNTTEESRSFVSTNGRHRIVLGLRDGLVVRITLAGPIGSAFGPYVLKGTTQVDFYHWQNVREQALITRSYTGDQEVYRVDWVSN